MSTKNLFRLGGAAVIIGVLLMFGAYSVPILLALSFLFMAGFYYALTRLPGVNPGLLLAACASTVVGGIGFFATGTTPSTLLNIFVFLAFMLPALLGALGIRGSTGVSKFMPWLGIFGSVLGLINAVVNIMGGGDYTHLSSPALTMVSNLTYYPATLLIVAFLVWGAVHLFKQAK